MFVLQECYLHIVSMDSTVTTAAFANGKIDLKPPQGQGHMGSSKCLVAS